MAMRFRKRRDAAGESAPEAVREAAEDAWSEGTRDDQPGSDVVSVDAESAWESDEFSPEQWLGDLAARLTAVMSRRGVPVGAEFARVDGGWLCIDVDGKPLRVHSFTEDDRRPIDGVDRLLGRLNGIAAAAGSERRWRIAYLADAFGDAAFTSEAAAATAPWADLWELPGHDGPGSR
jgi:hypothetical protein